MANAPQTPVLKDAIGIHVLSGQRGESIIVSLPDEHWFIIDSFEINEPGKQTVHPVMTFAERFGLIWGKCRFVLLTHLHEDHFAGLPELVGMTKGSFANHSVYLRDRVASEFLEAICEKENRDSAISRRDMKGCIPVPSSRSARAVVERCRKNASKQYQINQWTPLFQTTVDSIECHVTAVAPSTECVESYLRECIKLEGKISKAIAENRDPTHDMRSQNAVLNNMSVSLLVSYGKAKVLLPGDMEKDGWIYLEKAPEAVSTNPLIEIGSVLESLTFIKAPHHGSKHSNCGALQGCYKSSASRLVATTHHKLAKQHSLPDRDGVKFVLDCGCSLLVPNITWLEDPDLQNCLIDESQPMPKITVPIGEVASYQDEQALQGRYQLATETNSNQSEVHWVSISFDRDGEVKKTSGGSYSALVRKM